MKEQTIVETVQKETKKYVACDGKPFDKEYECREYEFDIKFGKALEDIEHCKELDGCPPFDGGEYMENHDYYWFRPKSAQELMQLLDAVEGDSQLLFSRKYIGRWICIELASYDRDCVWLASFDDGVSYVSRLGSELGYDVILRKRKTEPPKDFEDHLCERNDFVDNKIYQLVLDLTGKRESELGWDMSVIGDVTDAISAVLETHGMHFCHPYHEGDSETPCYKGCDCPINCKFKEA